MRRLAPCVLLLALFSWTVLPASAYDTGQAVAPFSGTDSDGKAHKLADYAGKPVVLVVWASKCPISRSFGRQLAQLAGAQPGVAFLGVAPAAGETAASVAKGKQASGIGFPVLLDGGGSIAKAFGAVMSPTVYVIGPQGKLQYQGAIADKAKKPTQEWLKSALADVLAGKTPAVPKTRVKGLKIKY